MRTGLIARSDYSGLSMQTRAIKDLLEPTKVLLVDSTPFNGRVQHPEWFPGAQITNGFPTDDDIVEFLKDLDVVISCEIPYNENLYKLARERNVKTIIQPNAELNPHLSNPRMDKPSAWFLPSPWFAYETKRLGIPTYLAKPPILLPRYDPQHIDKQQGELRVLHFGGRKAAFDRNGTELVRSLPPIDGVTIDIHDQSLNEVADQREIYERGYHLVLIPRKYGGLCLPMLESLSHHLPVLMPNIQPNLEELPAEWLIKVASNQRILLKHRLLMYTADTNDIVRLLTKFRDMNQESYDQERDKAQALHKQHQEQLVNWHKYIKEVVE